MDQRRRRPYQTRRRRSRQPRAGWLAAAAVIAAAFWFIVLKPGSLAGQGPMPTTSATLAGPIGSSATPTVARPTPVPSPTVPPLQARFALQYSLAAAHPVPGGPEINGKAGLIADLTTGEVLFSKDGRERLAMASTTKIMTAIVALESAPLDREITVTEDAVKVEPNLMGLSAGERLTLNELLYGMMLDSGNDAAEAVAQGLMPRSAFIAAMNDKAAALGLVDTHFTNPSGLDDDEHYTSAYDLAVMARYGLENADFRRIVGTKRQIIESTATHKWFGPTNLNRLLWTYPGAIGVKPGNTDNAGYTLVAAAERDGHRLVAVVLGSNAHFTDATTLLDFGFVRVAEAQ